MQTYWYTTANEIEFLEKLGTYCAPTATLYQTRAQLLMRYRSAAARRMSWEGINRTEVLAYVERSLK